MKNLILFATLVLSFSAFAKGATPILNCSNGEEINVDVFTAKDGNFRAVVTVQSIGDSYPTYHFSKIVHVEGPLTPGMHPEEYKGSDFDLRLIVAMETTGELSIPSLSLKNEKLECGKVVSAALFSTATPDSGSLTAGTCYDLRNCNGRSVHVTEKFRCPATFDSFKPDFGGGCEPLH